MPLQRSLLLFAICLFSFLSYGRCQKKELRLQFLVPRESASNFIYFLDGTIPAAQLAVRDINKRSDYLPDYELVLEYADTKCDPSEGTWQMIKSVLDTSDVNATKIIAFVGAGCSIVTEPTAALSGQLYKVVQVSYASASPILSDKSMYPLFFRTYSSQNLFNNVYLALMYTYKWCIVATLHQTVNLFSLAVTDFHTRFEDMQENSDEFKELCSMEDKPILFSFTGDPEIPLRQIMTKDVRIIFGYFYEDKAIVVMCYAKHMGLTADKYLWILPGWYTDDWWRLADGFEDWSMYKYNCTSQDIKESIRYSLASDFYTYPLEEEQNEKSISNYTTEEFKDAYEESWNNFISEPNRSISSMSVEYSTLSYDAIWSLAIALNKTENVLSANGLSLSDFEYSRASPDEGLVSYDDGYDDTNNNLITNNLSYFLHQTDFRGVSGNVSFDANGDRTGYSIIFQYRADKNGNIQKVPLARYNYNVTGLQIEFDEGPEWKTGSPPTDRSTPVNVTISTPLIIAMDILVAIGIIIAISLLVFNTVTIQKALIRDSAPLINTVIIIGCIMLMATCILLGIDSNNPKRVEGPLDLTNVTAAVSNQYATICTVRLWFLTIGFTLSFGALFAKIFQVYRVYTNPSKKEEPFTICNFLIIMGILLVLDIIILSVWTGLYNFERGEDERTDGNSRYIYEYCKCENFSYLIGALYVYKGLMTIFGLFLAYESRNVKYKYINDSRFVSIAMYIVVILVGISSLLSLVLAEERFVDAAYGVAVFIIVLACTSCLLILYIPKFYYMAKGKTTMVPATKLEKFTPVDKLQLGKTEVNPEDIVNADKEIKELKEQVEKGEYQLQEMGDARRGSDQDSGVHCTTTEETDGSNNSPTALTGMTITDTCITQITTVSSTNDGGENGSISLEQGEEEVEEGGDGEESDSRNVKEEISKC